MSSTSVTSRMTDRTVVTDAAEANAAAAALGQPPTARRVEHSGLWPYSLVTTHNVNSQPKFSRSASRLALIRQVYVGRIGTHKG
jgi:hypothetical protein